MELVNLPTHSTKETIDQRATRLVNQEVYHRLHYMVQELAKEDKWADELLEVICKTEIRYEIYNQDGQPVTSCYNEEQAEKTVQELGEGFHYEEEEDHIEALEHWAVSSWLADELAERGEMVTEFMDFYIWGRTCSGQAIMLDGVIQDIAKKECF